MSGEMASLQTLKSLVNERLSAAAEEIFCTLGIILTEYEEEAVCLKQEIDRQQKLLGKILKPKHQITESRLGGIALKYVLLLLLSYVLRLSALLQKDSKVCH